MQWKGEQDESRGEQLILFPHSPLPCSPEGILVGVHSHTHTRTHTHTHTHSKG